MGIAEKIYEKLKDAPEPVAQEVLDFLGYLEAKHRIVPPNHNRSMSDYDGCLADSKFFKDSPLEIQHKLRAEWDREWD